MDILKRYVALQSTVYSVAATTTSLLLDTLGNSSLSDTWSVEVMVNNKPIKFLIVTGADATCLSVDIFEQLLSALLYPAGKVLCNLNYFKLNVAGYFLVLLQQKSQQIMQTIYMLHDVHQPLFNWM